MWAFFSRDPSKDFAYEIGEQVSNLQEKSIWVLHNAKKKGSGEIFSAFIYDGKRGSDVQLELVKVALKRLKTLRHPNILTYVDSLETDRIVYLVTEHVEPLHTYITSRREEQDYQKFELNVSWGLHQLVRALSFLNNDCGLIHNNVCVPSIFVNDAGEWKLAGVEYICKISDGSLPPPVKIIPGLDIYDPPEKRDSSSWYHTSWSTDIWGLGCLIWEVFNGELTKAANLKSPGKIPKALIPVYCEMVAANPTARPNSSQIIAKCSVVNGYLRNKFVETLLFLEELQIKDSEEKTRFFNSLAPQLDGFPEEMCRYKILPQLVTAFEFGSASPAILAPLFKLGKLLNADDYQKKIVPCVIKLFSSTDRATRAKLLQQLEHFVDHLQPNVINNQIFPEMIHGFMDTNATIREITVKAMLHVVPKLNHNNLNIELMKHFARLQAKDDQGGIRTNTTVCLGKMAHHLHPDTRKKVLVPAFTRAMRDPFPPARVSGILALAATQKFFHVNDVAGRVLPVLCQMTIDPEKSVREQAFKTIKGFLTKLERISEDPSLMEQMESEVNASASTTMTDVAYSWAGWAVTSLTSKFYKSSIDKSRRSESPSGSKPSSESIVNTENVFSPTVEVQKESAFSKMSRLHSSSSSTTTTTTTTSPISGSVDATHGDSDSDYAGDWGDDWGDMESQAKPEETTSKQESGWEASGWEDTEFVADTSNQPFSTYNWGETASNQEDLFTNISSVKPQTRVQKKQTSTPGLPPSAATLQQKPPTSLAKLTPEIEESSWDQWDDTSTGKVKPSLDDREFKRNQRKKELEERRATRQASGPLKLGEKKKPF